MPSHVQRQYIESATLVPGEPVPGMGVSVNPVEQNKRLGPLVSPVQVVEPESVAGQVLVLEERARCYRVIPFVERCRLGNRVYQRTVTRSKLTNCGSVGRPGHNRLGAAQAVDPPVGNPEVGQT